MHKIKTKSAVEGIVTYPLGDSPEDIKAIYNLKTVRKMSDNENVYGCSSKVKDSISRMLNSLNLYPDGTTFQLKKNLANYYQQSADRFIVGNGSEEIIRLLARAYINPNDEAVIAEVTFPRYETNVIIEGGKAIKVPLKNGVHDLDGMYEKITNLTKMVFICNPNNPTGTIVGKKELQSFIEKVPVNVLVILDEAYYEYVSSDNYLQSLPLLDKHPNLIILRTFSKIYGLASIRVGYGIMAAEIVKELLKVKDVFNVNQFAQTAAVSALEDLEFVKDCSEKNEIEREFVSNKLHQLGIGFYPSQSNFLFVFSHYPLAAELIKNGLIVRQMKLSGYADAFRITLGTRKDNTAFLDVARGFLNERMV